MKDPGFIFYPGDYLRDTQCLSEKVQVAYDRIMCEHMRNICISQQQLKFFTKRLTDDEIDELMTVVSETEGGFHIEWVAESILKRRAYSDSRRENRKKKTKQDMINMSSSYDEHMDNENENENENEIINDSEIEKLKTWKDSFEIYKNGLDLVYNTLISDDKYLKEQEELHPNVDVILSLKKAYTNFWSKEAGWKYKKKQRSKDIDWVSTLTNAIDMNKVYKQRSQSLNVI